MTLTLVGRVTYAMSMRAMRERSAAATVEPSEISVCPSLPGVEFQ
jgi:hypothetical protein